MGDKIDITDLVENGKNAKQICCIRCKSKILPPQMGTYEVFGSQYGSQPFQVNKYGNLDRGNYQLNTAAMYEYT